MHRRAPHRVVIAAIVLGLALYYLLPASQAAVYKLLALGSVGCVLAGVRRHRPASARAWRALAAGMALFIVGDVLALAHGAVVGGTPFPSLGEPAYLAAYPMLLVGSIGIRGAGARPRDLRLDTMVVVTGVCVFAWPLVVAPSLAAPAGSPVDSLLGLAYPIGDLLLLAAGVRMLLHRSAQSPSSIALAVGYLALLVGDAVYQHQLLEGWYQPGTFVDAAWFVAYGAAAYAALHPTMADEVPPPPVLPSAWRTVAVGFALLAPPLAAGFGHDGQWALVAVWLLLVVMVLWRLRGLVVDLLRTATHDDLTGLANRVGLEQLAAEALAAGPAAVLFCDLDDFRTVNEGVGHVGGDAVLRAVAERLRHAVRPGDGVARFGGDEFAIVCPGVAGVAEARALAQHVRDLVSTPLHLAGAGEVAVFASVGAAVGHGRSAAAMLQDADVAMCRAKRRGGIHVVEAGADADRHPAVERLRVASGLRRAIPNGELRLHYQPEVALADGTLVGFEALLRWQRAPRDLVPPGDFIPAAEASGEIVALGAWALEEACEQLLRWGDGPSVAVNVSARQLADPDFPDAVLQVVRGCGLDPTRLCLEVTETSVAADLDTAAAALARIKNVGVSIAIDDFGTGHSSLSQLRRLPVDLLKIDRSFVSCVDAEEGDRAVVRAIVSMAHALGMRTVAEGVETEGQLHVLRALGCDFAQGFLIARPAPADDAARFLRQLQALPL